MTTTIHNKGLLPIIPLRVKDRILNVILDKCSTMSYILSDVEADRHMQFRYIVEGSYNVGDDNL